MSILDRLPQKTIYVNGSVYLRRYYLCYLFGYHWCLHCFEQPDPDRGLHNHPWYGVSIILRGRYVEERLEGIPPEGKRVGINVRSYFNIIKPNTFHRISALLADRVWTLFGIGKDRVQGWGFLRSQYAADGTRKYWVQDWRELTSSDTYDIIKGDCPLWKEK